MNKIIKNLSIKVDRLELGNKNQNKPIPEGERNQTNLEDLLFLDVCQEKDEIMIFRGRGEKMKSKGFNLHFKIIM